MAIETLDDSGGGAPAPAAASSSGRRQLWGVGVSPVVAQTLSQGVGPALLTGLVDLVGSGAAMTSRDWLEAAVVTRELVSFCQALQLTCVRELDRSMDPAHVSEAVERPGGLLPGRRAADELAPALGCAPSTASRLVGLARRLDALPAAADALADKRMDLTQVRALDTVTQQLPPPHVAAVEALAVRLGRTRTSSQLRVQLETAAAGLDPVFVQRQVENGIAERDLRFGPSPLPGCHRLTLDLPTLQALGAWHAVNGAAVAATRRGRGGAGPESRSLPQLRADLAASVLTGQAGDGDVIPSAAELLRHAEVHVVVGADTLRGVDEAPAHVPGAGPLDAATAREVASTNRWRRLVVDPVTGTLLHRDRRALPAVGGSDAPLSAEDARWERILSEPVVPVDALMTTAYRPTPRLRSHVESRDGGCIGPACEHSTQHLELDHTVNFGETDAEGRRGTTSAGNLAPECLRVHHAKTHGGWRLRQPSPGRFEWTSPLGRTYASSARPVLPGWKPP